MSEVAHEVAKGAHGAAEGASGFRMYHPLNDTSL